MATWKKSYTFFAKKITNPVRKLKVYFKYRYNWLGLPLIIAYRGYGNNKFYTIKGSVVEDKRLAKPEHNNSIWENITAMIKRYTSDEIPGVKVLVRVDKKDMLLVTDENGMFETTIESKLNGEEWVDYEAEIISDVVKETKKICAKGEIMVPGKNARFGIISDIDDTILVSHSTQTMKKLQLMLLRNAYTRKPFPGVAAFYRSLNKGPGISDNNPIFYVSSSEWNLYDLLTDFCNFNKFPKGVFLLREIETDIFKFWKSGRGNHNHKFDKIKTIFNSFPHLSFILVGDNGQQDPYIYLQIAKEFPARIKAIYIRSVVIKKNSHTEEVIKELNSFNIDVLLVKNTFEAAIHAAKNNLIPESALSEISREVHKDMQQPGELKQMVKF